MYSQNNEEEYILDYFKGTLLDIGANNGKALSNSAALIDMGWRAVMVEPAPKTFKELKKNYKGNKRVTCLNLAITETCGKIPFYSVTDSLVSSSIKSYATSWNKPIKEIMVKSLDWETFSKQYGGDYDFISIDAEGCDWSILKKIDLTKVRMVCAEHGNTHEKEMREYCESFGMKLILRNFENILMAR